MKNRKKMILTALCAAVLFAGCTTASAVSLEEAQSIALNTAGVADAIFTERHLDPDDGVYEISFTSGGLEYAFEVDARSGAVRELDRDRVRAADTTREPRSTEAVTTPADRITGQEAKAAALTHAGIAESDAWDWDIEWDDGRWEVSFHSGNLEYDYDISAEGAVLRAEKEVDD